MFPCQVLLKLARQSPAVAVVLVGDNPQKNIIAWYFDPLLDQVLARLFEYFARQERLLKEPVNQLGECVAIGFKGSDMKYIENQLLVFPSGLGGVVGKINRLALEQLGHIINVGRVEVSGSKKLLS
ncbi:hypothetical protein GCM10007390_48490 [Persicitalea jodogahamensis]|uniref:Uncharacterized protein n=1 Tax=Persicitalea jodogahamensis TaxID=402147 RepID=A0A8J3GB10_9BACT|nr:hypothetical protein [Persicitalea jodogahamensis]GHB86972.1 hypothetical protein GCM10007390_48490 [Persicitalea jodogahamensis]